MQYQQEDSISTATTPISLSDVMGQCGEIEGITFRSALVHPICKGRTALKCRQIVHLFSCLRTFSGLFSILFLVIFTIFFFYLWDMEWALTATQHWTSTFVKKILRSCSSNETGWLRVCHFIWEVRIALPQDHQFLYIYLPHISFRIYLDWISSGILFTAQSYKSISTVPCMSYFWIFAVVVVS